MGFTVYSLIIICFLASGVTSNCSMEGVTFWQLPIILEIEDYHEGVFLERAIENIQGFSVAYYDDLNQGPYVSISIANSMFVISTNEAFRQYEENETVERLNFAVTFTCADGTNSPVPLNIQATINDNNNHDPLWKTEGTVASPDTTYDFTIATPVAPGFAITDCVRDIIVRDVDLTTYAIEFGIDNNPYFVIEYDPSSSTVDKEFKASLRTTTFIRSIPEPIVLRISATDVDRTQDPPITTYSTVTIRGSSEFVLPEEPVFSQPLYRATYNGNNQVVLEETISLQQGYDAQVQFSLEGDYTENNFGILVDGNQVSLTVTNPLPSSSYREGQIHLVVKATRENTSGASATIVVQLPQAVNLEFERAHYEGEIVDNTLQLTQLVLSQGYQESTLTVSVEDYSSFFTATPSGNIITLSMTTPLDANIIGENNFINLRVTASTDYSSATAIVTLEIIKDDIETPLFERPLYTGTYESNVLTLEPLLLVQGYDNTVQVNFSGEHDSYFELIPDGSSFTLRVLDGGLPSSILSEQHILLSIEATKPRTVGATTVVSIALPAAVNLEFERAHYEGEIVDNNLQLTQLILSQGYQESTLTVSVEDYSSFFTATPSGNIITLSMTTPLDANIIEENNFINLRVTASTDYSSATAIVTLEIIKDDIETPLFERPLYTGTYESNVLTLEPLLLVQGYDNTVQVNFSGEHDSYFELIPDGPSFTLRVLDGGLPSSILSEQHILLSIEATKPRTVGATTVVSIALPAAVNLEFERAHYEGEIVDNTLQLTQLVLSQGYQEPTLTVSVEDYPSFFTATPSGNIITLSMTTPLDANIIGENNFINLRVTASTDYSSATAIVTLEIIKDDIETPLFERPLYTGTYESNVLTLEPLLLVQGYDNTVQVNFSGEHDSYFELIPDGPSFTLRVLGGGLPSSILSEQHILLSIEATKPRTVGATTVVSIALPAARQLEFEAPTYSGSLQDNILTLETIVLSGGYADDVVFYFSGDYSDIFYMTSVENQVTIHSMAEIPDAVISENNFLMLTIYAAGPNALRTSTAVLLEIIKDDVTTPVFGQSIYYGNYLGSLDIDIGNINLAQGYDNSVTFRLEGENSQYFEIRQVENSLTLAVQTAIPEELILNEKAFVLNVFADKPLSVGANAAIFIRFSEELTEPSVLQFDKNTYTGSVENNILTLEDIVLGTGFAAGTEFHLTGDHSSSFTPTVNNNVISLSLSSELSAEVLDSNKFLLLELEARRDRAVPVSASIIIDLVKEEIPIIPVFNQAFYTGEYTEENMLQFEETISLLQGYDETVTFELEGDSSAWFTLSQVGNALTLVSSSNVPQEVLDSYHQLLFTVVASKPNAINGEAAISISLPKEILEQEVLRFAQNSYEGRLNETDLQVSEILLVNEITDYIDLTMSGNYAEYFRISHDSNIVIIELVTSIPSEVISSNEFLIFDITASKQDAVSGYTTLILRIDKEPQIVKPLFEQAYYSGEYTEQSGLLFEHTLRLIQGFDETVSFTLQGDGSQWFILTQTEQNRLTLSTREGGIQQTENTNHLVFSVLADKPGTIPGEAAIVIDLSDLNEIVVLGFEQVSYLGTIDNNVANIEIEPIILSEGYTTAVTFVLQGDLSTYFSFVQQGSSVTIVLETAIPEQSMPSNRIIMLELQATAPDAIPALTAVVFEVVREDDIVLEELVFSAPYYTGQLSEAEGLVFETAISLDEGYDQNIQFALDGEHAQWFTLVVDGNSVTLATSGPIPPAVLANNQQLVFVITAQKPNSNTARATIVISLVDDLTDAAVLGFERASYLGTIENDAATIEPIVLNEGYTPEVTFTLHGDLADYFVLVQQGSSVTITLRTAIPEQYLPANGIVILELQATALDAIPALTAVVFEVVREDVAMEELVFSAPYYTGEFSEEQGLVFETAISLDEGYDQNIQFALEGEHAQWFTLVVDGNFVTLATSGPIPPAVLANNQQLVFVITAQKPNSNTARATIVISLVDDLTDAAVLGFERASYLGTIENDAATIEPIVLNEGYTPEVTFTLHGDLADYFVLVQQGASVTITLRTAIPEQSLPANGIVILELQATALDAIPALTAVVFEVVREDVAMEELVFSAPYYTGEFSEEQGLVFETAISLDAGYDQNIQFALDGEHAQWFTLVVDGNSVTLATSGPIPPAVLANNQQLVFVITAQKPNSNTARATIVISLVDDLTDAAVLGFERASYLGTIENDAATIEPIVLNEGYTPEVTFTLHGDLADYFVLVQQGASVTITLRTAIPEQSLPANGIVILELQATALDAIPALTAVVFEVVREDVAMEELVFSAPYYTGEFSEEQGLVFETAISLDAGYDQNIQFALDGEHAQWFTLVVDGNSVTLATSGPIPPAVLANNQQLVFVITAQKSNSNTARATIVISLVDDLTDAAVLGFERASYLGTIENDAATIEPIVLNEGYTPEVTFTLHGDLADYFVLVQQGASVTITLRTAIPAQSLPANGIVILELQATALDAIPALTAVVFEVVREDVAMEELVFSAPYYTGEFSEEQGLVFETAISLDAGYDQNIQFALDGEHAQWFTLVVDGNSVTLATSGPIPPAVLANNQQLVFVITAQKPNSNTARATIVISLVDDLTDAAVLGFERASYLGTIENDAATIEPIVLNEGYTPEVTFTLHGDLADYFVLVQQGASVTITLRTAIPEQSLPANGIVILELQATALDAIPALTAVVFEVVREDVAMEELVFSAPYYTGEFSEEQGLVFETAISLDAGYDQNIQFALDGEHAQWFTLVVDGNSVTLATSGPIPPAVLANNQQLVFVITAQKPNSNTARATIVISLVDDLTDAAVLGFERASYLGTIENDAATIEPIVLNEGYTPEVTFTLHGDLADYFVLVQQGPSVFITLRTAIPEQSLPANGIVILELQATALDAIPALTAIVFEVVREDVAMEELVFSAPYYTGEFSEEQGLVFETAISLDAGYDQNIQFALDGEHAQWFTLVVDGNSVTPATSGPIPPAVLANNQQLVFVITAQKPNSNTARATIVISLVDDLTDAAVLGFERASYLGTIENDAATIEPIVLNEGYTPEVTFTLHGDLADYFVLVQQGASVTITLRTAIPEQSLPANGIVILELQATALDAIPALTAVVFEVVREDVAMEELVFSAPYYTGEFSEEQGLVFETAISLDAGYDQNIQFALDGEHAQWFTLVVDGNSVTLATSGPIPPAVLANNQQLVFVITAQKPNNNTARATIVISLVDDLTDAAVLGFERASYLGTIENDAATIEPIILNEGYTPEVTFTLHGDLADYFVLVQQGASVTITLRTAIPEQYLPANGIVILELQATALDAIPALTAVVFEVVREDVAMEELVFSAPYYTGEFSEKQGLVFETAISLDAGYDQNIQFALDGEHAQWFTLVVDGNSVTLATSGPIPPAVLANNQQLVFVITAQKPNSNTARATIVISLVDDLTDAAVLGFERASYLGTIENDAATIEPIVLNEGYTPEVTFTLHGDLADYFVLVQQGPSVFITLRTAIPEQSLPANGIVILELQATALDAIPALTAIVFEVVREDVAMEELVFSAPYYTGEFSEEQGLVFETAISLDAGYDQNTQFALDGEHAQWFTLVVDGNSVTLATSGPIPPAVLANNQQLVFVITAQKPNSNTARATIVISLVDDLTDAAVLGFERASYLGTIENDAATIEPIVLNEGYTPEVTFTLHGDLADYFVLVQQGASVTITLRTAIPEQSLPANGIVILELQATALDAIPALTAVVFEVVREDVAMEELVFSAPYYTGEFSEEQGLVFETAISLDAGYDQNIQFALDGEHAQWFTLVVDGNSVTLATSGPIPPAVLANNQQLVFVITAQKPNSNTARATIVISLVDDLTDAAVLGFERASYLGTIENDAATIEPIILNEGYTPEVTFTLHGDLADYFVLVQQGASVTITLRTAIPEQYLPANGIVILELQATALDAIPALTAVVFEVVREDVAMEELVFSAPYYTGEFSEEQGLVFETAISLDEGYDQNIQFALDGEHAQWFTLVVDGNSVTLATSGPIPPAVLANNQQLVFVITAQKSNSNTARATIVISLVDDLTDAAVLGFERASYLGTIENDAATIEPIVLNEGYTPEVTFTLHGDLADYFVLVQQGSSVTITLRTAIPEQSLPANGIVILELQATALDAIPALTAVVFEVVREDVAMEELVFSAPYYTGEFSEKQGLVFETAISLDAGYDQNIQFALDGEHAQWFTLVVDGNSVTLATSGPIPPAVLANNQQLVFVITAQKPNSNTARATIVISLVDDLTDAAVLGFERASYLGTIENDAATIEPIVLNEGYTPEVTFTLHGDLADYFVLVQQGASVTITLQTAIPEESIPANGIVILELQATALDAIPALTAVVFEVVREDVAMEELVFSAPYYTGEFSEEQGLVFETAISLDAGYDQNIQFALDGEHAQWFTLVVDGNSVTLATSGPIPPAVLANNQQLVFVITAQKPNSNTARATIVISLVDDLTDAAVLGFERASYLGTIENDAATIEPIVLNEGYTPEVTFTLHGDLADYFVLVQQGSSVTITLRTAIPEQSLPANGIVILELQATALDAIPALTAVVFEVVREDVAMEELVFSAPYYTGEFSEEQGLVFETAISLDAGYDQNIQFALDGEHAQWFTLVVNGNSVTLTTSGPIPPAVLANNQQLVFVITAQKPNSNTARATIVISLVDGSESATESFDKVLYEGTVNLNVVQHEPITVAGYTGSTVEILGDYSHLFEASLTDGSVVVVTSGSLTLPEHVTLVPLELRAGAASAVLLLDVIHSETPELPTVVFGSLLYVMQADMAQTGLIGQVSAVASNGERVAYTLAVTDAHLQERVSINGDGEVHLSAPTNTGVYTFEVIATSVITQVEATAAIQLTVESAVTCGEDEYVLPPLIILDRDEEEPHENLVVLDSATQAGCSFRLTNRWPAEHDWLYVDENGLHARVIDREDPRIAFMALSQIQAELVLECASDTQTRVRRSLNTNSRLDWLGPYDYGSNRWILTDTIEYNSRRSFVNLIVNDINDNYPIFIGNENTPVVVGYPIPELEEVVLPRALAELKATDADVGENAQLMYWSSEPALAVAPATGSVHVRDGATLTDEQVLTVSVTDLNGREDGLTTSMQLTVKLIDVRHIAVVTVRNAFLDEEETILSNLTSAVGYEVKVLRSAVISDDTDTSSENARNNREVTSEGASLQLYVYGLIDREPVAVDRLSTDISENVASIDVTSTISLEDHLEAREIPGSAGRDTGLLVATIVLSVLLFILIVAIAVYFFLRWRKARTYEQFSDANSVASGNETLEQTPKVDNPTKPRLNLEELKRSERRLQEMLVAPVEDPAPKPSTSAVDPAGVFDTIINMAPPDTPMPIVIQSIDKLKDNANSEDEDEFGERTNKSRRKSVVTFNENVEKIIHVEDIPDDNSSVVEVFRL